MLEKFFNKHEMCFIEAIINYLGNKIEFDKDEALNLFNIKSKNTVEHIEKLANTGNGKCKVRLKTMKQCSRSANETGFCLTHYKQFTNNKLTKADIIDNTEMSRFDVIIKKMREIREIPRLVQTNLIYIDKEEYLHDPISSNIYDFDTLEKIGKLDKFKQIKLLEI